MLDRLGAGFSGPIHVVFGNNDGDGRLLQTIAQKYPQIHLHGIYAEVTFGNTNAALIHYPEPALRIAQSGQFHVVAYGHNHVKKIEIVENSVDNSCVLVNPGEILGMRGTPTLALYDGATRTCVLEEV
jgi:predicted phosphodiesterase